MKLPTDKLLHFLVCFIIALVAWIFSGALLPWLTFVASVILRLLTVYVIVTFAAVGKELYDRRQSGNHFCRKDLAWDYIGAAAGCVTGFIYTFIS